MFKYTTSGVCSREVQFDIEDGKVKEINFVGGCPGNLIGISSLVKGMSVDDVIKKTEGIKCGRKNTSCPDQLAQALKLYKEKYMNN